MARILLLSITRKVLTETFCLNPFIVKAIKAVKFDQVWLIITRPLGSLYFDYSKALETQNAYADNLLTHKIIQMLEAEGIAIAGVSSSLDKKVLGDYYNSELLPYEQQLIAARSKPRIDRDVYYESLASPYKHKIPMPVKMHKNYRDGWAIAEHYIRRDIDFIDNKNKQIVDLAKHIRVNHYKTEIIDLIWLDGLVANFKSYYAGELSLPDRVYLKTVHFNPNTATDESLLKQIDSKVKVLIEPAPGKAPISCWARLFSCFSSRAPDERTPLLGNEGDIELQNL